uniref:Translocase of outer mitochondrial membrane 70 homolog A (S. cerevisiae) n=1 Tax=Eptatretus burgeri TaxID=7764 RepID=A0A8C4NG68_EPTBU
MAADSGSTRLRIAAAVGVTVAVGATAYLLWRYRRCHDLPSERRDPDGGPASALTHKSNGARNDVSLQPSVEACQVAKNSGNDLFRAEKYTEAVECYTQALALCPSDRSPELATCFQNRAAAQEKLGKWEAVLHDCSRAVDLNPKYVKALARRTRANEQLGNKTAALEDITAVCILQGFTNQSSMLTADRILKEMGREKARETFRNRKPMLPSKQFIRSYFSSFVEDGIGDVDVSDTVEDSSFITAIRHLAAGRYESVHQECEREIEEGGRWAKEAQLLRATFLLLVGDGEKAQKDLEFLIASENIPAKVIVNALIKRGSLHMQMQSPTESIADFEHAAELAPDNADVFHHRGQLFMLLERIDDAIADFEKCIKLQPDFALVHAQLAFSKYRRAMVNENESAVKSCLIELESVVKKFPKSTEACALYAQALTDQQEFPKAEKMYDNCISLEPDNATPYVHKGLLQLQWKQDLEGGVGLISRALKVDSKCDFAYETLATIEVQRGNLERAISLFHHAIELARSEMEIAHLLSLCDAAHAQSSVMAKYGLRPPF